jgi:hypothetical protein
MSTQEDPAVEQITASSDAIAEDVPAEESRRWGPTNVTLAVGIVLGLVAATIVTMLALGVGSDADDARQRTDALRGRTIVLQGRATATEKARDRLVELRKTALSRIEDLGAALGESEVTQNAYVDIVNRGADQHNAGDPGGAAATFRGEGQAAFDRMAEEVAAADRALVAVQTAIHDLEEALQ